MKYFILVLVTAFLACASGEHFKNNVKPFKFSPSKLNQDISAKIDWDEIRALVGKDIRSLRSDSVEADVTNYTLALLENVAQFIIESNLEPLGLSDEEIDLFPGSLTMTNGTLSDLSTITAYDNVIVKYNNGTGILELTLPLGFDSLVIKYNYKVKVLLVSVSGTITAKVSNLKLNLHLGFNFTEYHAFVDKVDVKDSGSITIGFTGLGVLDYLVEILTDTLTTLFHTLILSVVDAIIYDPVNSIVDQINSVIDSILHPNSTSFGTNYYN